MMQPGGTDTLSTLPRFHAFALFAALLFAPLWGQAQTLEITEPFIGVRHIHRVTTSPRLLSIHIVEIDMKAAGIGAIVTPSNGSAAGETTAQTTRAFVQQQGVQIGINGSFFSANSGGGLNISGLAASKGDVYSIFEAGRNHALNITSNNVASIIRGTSPGGVFGTTHTPATTLYNALTGSERIVDNGLNTSGTSALSTELHPRSAAGVTADGKLLLFTVDGRNAGHSLGMSLSEVADTLIEFGARHAINLDGGGSTTMVFAETTTPKFLNVPVGNGSPNTERAVGNNLGIYALKNAVPSSRYIYTDFEGAEANFGYEPTWSGSTAGILSTSSARLVTAYAHSGKYSQQIHVVRDPSVASTAENPDGWFVRHVSGNPGASNPASRSANTPRATDGYVGFWAMTTTPGVEATIAIDNAADVTADRGILLPLIADGKWHRYAWNLDDNDHWEKWASGDGTITGSTFTIDSIQFFGGQTNATIFLDDVFHEVVPARILLSADFNADERVDGDDLFFWKHALGRNAGGDANGDGVTDGADFLLWQRQYGQTTVSTDAAAVPTSTIPEPAAATLAAWGAAFWATLGRRRRLVVASNPSRQATSP